MPLDFEKYAMKGNEFLNRLASKLGDENDRDHSARVLRAVLRTMRNHLSLAESEQILAQLPMAIKSVYVDGWRIHQPQKRIKTIEAFAKEVMQEDGQSAWRDYSNVDDAIASIRAVIETMVMYVSTEEMEEAFGTLPRHLRDIFIEWIPS
jgi:uncharacterized protein (DUF2267 family)